MIYFWKIKNLKSDLARKGISKRQTLTYLICILLIQAVSWTLNYSTGAISNLWDNINTASFFVLLIIGTIYCYYSNHGSKGKDFPNRYVSLAWVSGLRYYVMVIFPAGLALYLPVTIFAGLPDETQWFDALFEIVVRVPFYIILGRHIRDVSLNRVLSEQEISELEDEYDRDFDQSKYPTILRRYLATSIDLMFILSVFIVLAYMPGISVIDSGIKIGIGFSILFFYEAVLTGRLCTIGQKVTGIRVRESESGKRISIIKACLRTVVKLLLGFISFFSIPATRKRRALHDFAAGSIVIYAGREQGQ